MDFSEAIEGMEDCLCAQCMTSRSQLGKITSTDSCGPGCTAQLLLSVLTTRAEDMFERVSGLSLTEFLLVRELLGEKHADLVSSVILFMDAVMTLSGEGD